MKNLLALSIVGLIGCASVAVAEDDAAKEMAKKKAAVGKFFDEAALFELGKHLKEGGAAGPSDFEGAGEVFQRGGSVSKL